MAEALHRETEGNPFFIGEVLRHLAESGTLVPHDGGWRVMAGSIAELGIPEGVREVIGRRLSRLSDQANDVLGQAAVLGREFDVSLLQRVTQVGADEVDAAIEEAEAAQVIEAMGKGERYRFAHALVRETLYAEMSARRRVRLHRQVGEALEAQYARNPEAHLPELAHHFLEGLAGVDAQKAVDYARRAAEQAMHKYAYESAVRHDEAGLALLAEAGQNEPALCCDLLLALARALNEAGEPRRVLDGVAVEAFELAEALDDAERAGRACEQAWSALFYEGAAGALGTPEAEAWAERAARWARPGTAEQVRADLLGAGPRWSSGDQRGAVALATRALEAARRMSDPDLRWTTA